MEHDPYAEGADAFLAGKGEDANPYDTGGPLNEAALAWNDGWNSMADAAEED